MTTRICLLWPPIALALLACTGAQAQTSPADFHAQVASLYAFHPHTLTTAEVNAKSKELDAFWSEAKADPTHVLPLMREELERTRSPDFFAYDGAKLLLSLSTDKSDRELALASMPKADLLDVDNTNYLKTIHWFASQGFDTRAAAFRVLAYPDFKAFIPEHSLALGQDYALVYMLYPIEGVAFDQDLIDRLATEQDPRAQRSLLHATWYLMTPASMSALKAFGERPGVDPALAGFAKELRTSSSGLSFSLSSAETLRNERRKMMQRPISDEALIEFDSFTMKLLAKL